MKTTFKSTFAKDLKRIKDKTLLSRVQAAIIAVEQTDNLLNVTSCKKIQGDENYYRIRIGDNHHRVICVIDRAQFVATQQ